MFVVRIKEREREKRRDHYGLAYITINDQRDAIKYRRLTYINDQDGTIKYRRLTYINDQDGTIKCRRLTYINDQDGTIKYRRLTYINDQDGTIKYRRLFPSLHFVFTQPLNSFSWLRWIFFLFFSLIF